MRPLVKTLLALCLAALAPLGSAQESVIRHDRQSGDARLQLLATFEHQVTGVTVTPDGRIFVNFPRWTEDAPISVAELGSTGDLRPYPDVEWNSWRNSRRDEVTPQDHWVCVQSVVADKRGNLWVIDAGAPAQSLVVPGAPKLVQIDLTLNRVAHAYSFDETIAPQGSYLNDVRNSPDGRFVYITDSGVRGAIVVVDTASGSARRVLDGDPSTQADKSVTVKVDGKPLQQTDGRRVNSPLTGSR